MGWQRLPWLALLAGLLPACGSGGGGGGGAAPTFQFAYVAIENSDEIQGFSLDSASGQLTPLAGPRTLTGDRPYFLVGHPTLAVLYVACIGDSTIRAYRINGSGLPVAPGSLTALPGGPWATGAAPARLAMDPAGKFLLCTAIYGTVDSFVVDPVTGGLTPAPGSPYTATGAADVAVDPAGRFAFVGQSSSGVSGYSIHPVTGALTILAGSPLAAGNGPRGITMDPLGRYFYIGDSIDDDVRGFSFHPTTGAMAGVTGSPFAGYYENGKGVIDASGSYLYVQGADTLASYLIDGATGTLTPLAGSPLTLYQATAVGLHPGLSTLYLLSYTLAGVDIRGYSLNPANGALTALPGFPVSLPDAGVAFCIAFSPPIP